MNTATKAKQAALEKFRARPSHDDPIAVEQRAARLATSVARKARIAERKAARAAEDARLAVENAAREAEESRQAAGLAAAQAEQAAQAIELKAQQKAARDIRYAKRKARR